MVSFGVFVPTYVSGSQADLQNSMDRYTLINAIGQPVKMWIVFAVTVVIGISGHIFVYGFERTVRQKMDQHREQNKLSVSE